MIVRRFKAAWSESSKEPEYCREYLVVAQDPMTKHRYIDVAEWRDRWIGNDFVTHWAELPEMPNGPLTGAP